MSIVRIQLIVIIISLLPQAVSAQSYFSNIGFDSALPKMSRGELAAYREEMQQAYLASDLYQFQKIDTTSLESVWNFYTNVLEVKYPGTKYYEFFKLKFIQFAIRGFDLRLKESPEATRQLIVYTKELVKLRSAWEINFSYSCLEAIKDLIPKEELANIVKSERLKLIPMFENVTEVIDLLKSNSDSTKSARIEAEQLEMHTRVYNSLKELDSNFSALLN